MGRSNASSVGMMEGAFFVSRTELLQWVNSLLEVNLTKVEQCASGSIYCQILDSCHPGHVAMRKVNWMAKADHEYIPNYKVLQMAFSKLGIDKHIDVDKLIRAKYQDNLEFLQWMKCYWDREGAGRRDYDAALAREGRPLPPWARAVRSHVGPQRTAERPPDKENLRPAGADLGKRMVACAPRSGLPAHGADKPVHTVTRSASAIEPRSCRTSANMSFGSASAASADEPAPRTSELEHDLRSKLAAKTDELTELRQTLDGLERERDYYFRKLRNVEILCTTQQAQMDPELTAAKVIGDVQAILYAENEEDIQGDLRSVGDL